MMNIIKKCKDNMFTVVIAVIYIFMFIFKPDLGKSSAENSVYYIKEMLSIMPVIFVLTALLDTWVKKETIIKFLGKDSKLKGTFLAFVIGSISAGPIYAAFPFCVMLHKKGASIRNLVIILSSWAVIKVPMLLNEVKFLGFKFMGIRWILTVIAIFIFSNIISFAVKDSDLPDNISKESEEVTLNRNACMGCRLCTKNYPELFEMDGKKASVKKLQGELDIEKLSKAINQCPVKAIKYFYEK